MAKLFELFRELCDLRALTRAVQPFEHDESAAPRIARHSVHFKQGCMREKQTGQFGDVQAALLRLLLEFFEKRPGIGALLAFCAAPEKDIQNLVKAALGSVWCNLLHKPAVHAEFVSLRQACFYKIEISALQYG